jgi:hypothetical protein
VGSRLVVVVPLREGTQDEARRLLSDGPPLDLEATQYDRHEVFLTPCEVVFVFEAPGDVPPTLSVRAGDISLWRAAQAWQEIMTARPRIAETAFTWERGGAGSAPG